MIRVVVDDLAFLEVDAVLRPANHALEPISTAANLLDRMAGDEFAGQRRVSAPLEVGSAVVTAAGELAAPYVLHLVIGDAETNPDRHTIERALTSAWHRAAEWQLARIATPLIGAGAGQLDPEQAAGLLRATLEARTRRDYPVEVQLVVDHQTDRDLLSALLATGEGESS